MPITVEIQDENGHRIAALDYRAQPGPVTREKRAPNVPKIDTVDRRVPTTSGFGGALIRLVMPKASNQAN